MKSKTIDTSKTYAELFGAPTIRKDMLGISNAKTSKGESLGYLTGILYMIPADKVQGLNLCPFASKGCKPSCLESAGRGVMAPVIMARTKKTLLYRDHPEIFFKSLVASITFTVNKAKRKGMKAAIRLNGTSDIRFEYWRDASGRNLFELFPEVQFYDYTPDFKRVDALTGYWPNYHLTFSRKESRANHIQAEKLLKLGVNVAAVYRDLKPSTAIDGDTHDLRFLDKTGGHIVALTAKGKAKHDTSGFVIDYAEQTKQVA